MKILLDTAGLIWWSAREPKLGRSAARMIAVSGESGRLFVSAISAWEIAQKYSKGRLELPLEPDRYLRRLKDILGFRWLALDHADGLEAAALPELDHHKDPADRMIIAQARRRRLCLLTSDAIILAYGQSGHAQVEDLTE